MSMNLSDVVTIGYAANVLKLTPAALYLAIKEDRLDSIKVLGRIVIPRDEFNRLKRQRAKHNGNSKIK